ncbi:MAG: HIT domain-containing protein [Actinobacteria bacterium]|nr:HIT domain-containing protein [Actinomycetota bacterium]NCG38410.1 HIT domain-containing protein [Actinomycetota bacterium]
MPTIFTRIINGEIPGRFVVQDDICVAFLDVRPLARGHVLVVPRDEVDHWVDLSPEVASHLMVVAQRVGSAQRKLLSPARIGMMIAGFEVPHVHVHVVPMDSMAALDFSNANPNPDQGDLDQLRTDLAGLLE